MKTRPHLIPALVTALMLIMGTFGESSTPPYPKGVLPGQPAHYAFPSEGYFMLLRWVVMVVSLYIAYKGYKWKKVWVSWLFGFIAILFNPLVQITFSRETWQVFDVLCAFAFLTVGFLIKQPDTQSN